MSLSKLIFLFIGAASHVVDASGIDEDAYIRKIEVHSFERITVNAEISESGGLGKLHITSGKEVMITVKEADLEGFSEVDLKTLSVRIDSDAGKSSSIETFAVYVEYGDLTILRNKIEGYGEVELLLRPCVKFLFSGDRLVARYRAIPSKTESEWEMFIKVADKNETYEGIRVSRACPFLSLATVRFLPQIKQPSK